MKQPWALYLIPPFIISFLLMAGSQFNFLKGSLYVDLGLGRVGDELTLRNYLQLFSDTFYLNVVWVTVKVSGLATIFTLLLGFPVAYTLGRMRSRWSMVMVAGIVVSTFVTIVIKVYGLMIIFAADGWLNQALMGLGVTETTYSVIGTEEGVVIGLMHFTLGFGTLLLYSVVRTIPRSLEEAAQIHGAGRGIVYLRILLPLSLPGIVIGGLMIFNMCMGAFTSAALLGGGRIFTLPVLIQRSVMVDIKYSMAATLAAELLIAVILINLLSVLLLKRLRSARLVIA
jgi:putative spermidine/putrescine transport system permease protein